MQEESFRGCLNCVRACVSIPCLKFFARDDRLHIGHAVDGEDSVEMIDLVLQEFREIAIFPGFNLECVATLVLITDCDFAMALDLHENAKKTQAGVPHRNLLFAARDNFGIDERPGICIWKLQKDDALQSSNLRSRDRASV